MNRTRSLARARDLLAARSAPAGRSWRGRRTAASGTAGWWSASHAQAGHRHHAARHLPAAQLLRHPRPRRQRGTCPTARSARGDYWVEDNASALLQPLPQQGSGRLPLVADVRGTNASERLTDFPTQYEYADQHRLQLRSQVRHRGAGIFLHVNGRGATAGCVSVPRWFMRRRWPGSTRTASAGDRDRPLEHRGSKERAPRPPSRSTGHHLTLVNLEKVMYPRTGTTKAEVLNYYAQVAPVMLPHLADRAVTRIRWPHGTGDKSFFEKNTPGGTPSWVRTVTVPTTGSRTQSEEEGELTLPDHRRSRHADLAGQPRRPRAARPPVDGRRSRAVRRTPTGWSSTSTRVTRPGLGECSQVALLVRDRLAAGRPRVRAGHERLEGPAPVRRARRQAHLRGGARLRQGDRRGARVRSSRSWWSRR